MAEINKPDYTYQWASGGSSVAPSNVKIQTGWTAEIPPFQWENWSQNRQDQAITHILQKGISVWSSTGEYYFTTSGERSYVQGSDGNIYVAVADSVGQNPVTDTSHTYWNIAFTTAATLAASSPVIGSLRNGRINLGGASSTLTYTATEVVLKNTLGGNAKLVSNFSGSINISVTGVNGMDTGAAPVSGDVAIYIIYNPTTNVFSLLGKNSTAVKATEVYTGANMPSGYTSSALVAVLKTNASSQFRECFLRDRWVDIVTTIVISTTVTNTTPTPIVFNTTVPLNAIAVSAGVGIAGATAGVTAIANLRPRSGSAGVREYSISVSGVGGGGSSELGVISLAEDQKLYYTDATSSGAVSAFNISISGYQF